MLKWVQKHPVIWIIIGCLAVVIAGLAIWQRYEFKQNTMEKRLTNPPRSEEAYTDTFYPEQLTEKEKSAYQVLKDALEQFKGGEVMFPEALTGREFTRAYNALEYGEDDYFYGMVGIPMTKDNRNLTYNNDNILDTTEAIIAKCMVFLYPAEGIDENGVMDEEGYVTNLDELKGVLSTMNPQRMAEVEKLQKETEAKLDMVVAAMPADYGTKEAIDYFLEWMASDLAFDDGSQTGEINKMSQFFPARYYQSHLAGVVDGKVSAVGYARVLSALCNRAGIRSHLVMGTWKSKYFDTPEGPYALTCVEIDGENIYVDASGFHKKELMDQRYLNEAGAMKWLSFVNYFEYGEEK